MTLDDTTLSAQPESASENPAPASPPTATPAPVNEEVAAAGSGATEELAMLPEAELKEPPRPLTPGAFLKLEYEIKEVLVRGFTNLYLAHGGDYGSLTTRLIAEREEPAAPEVAAAADVPAATVAEGVAGETDVHDATVGVLRTDATEFEDSASAGALYHEASTFDAPLEDGGVSAGAGLSASAAAVFGEEVNKAVGDDLYAESAQPAAPALFPFCEEFAQEDRQYRVFDFVETTSLQDYRAATSDDAYLRMLHTLAEGTRTLEGQGLTATFDHDLLRVTKHEQLCYFGFFEPSSNASSNIDQLREVNEFLLKHVFANSRTMRLDDQFGGLALSEETRTLARRLSDGEYESVATLVNALEEIYNPDLPLRVRNALLSDVGQQRELNEDAGMILRLQRAGHLSACDIELYAVADGMGGHEGGEVASDLTLTTLQEILSQSVLSGGDFDWNDNSAVRGFLFKAIDAVNQKVASLAELPKYRGSRARPGSTLVLALRIGARLFVGNVGDSRAYKWNARHGLQRVTKDHSYVQTLIDAGSLNEEDAWDHPDGSIITAHIGEAKLRTRDVFLRLAARGDKLLLVSDGVVDMLRDREIAPFLQESDPTAVCRGLVDAANAAGGVDNITALCVSFE